MLSINHSAVMAAYNKLSAEQRQRFFPGKVFQAKKIIGSLCFLLGENCNYFRLLELYVTVAVRAMMGFDNGRINMTVKMRFSDLVPENKAITVIECIKRLDNNFAFIENVTNNGVEAAFDKANEVTFDRNDKRTEDAVRYPGFGIDPNNPIYAHAASGSYSYLNFLFTSDSVPLTWRRTSTPELESCIDILDRYELLLPNGKTYLCVYINMYARKTSIYCPVGLHSDYLKDIPQVKSNQTKGPFEGLVHNEVQHGFQRMDARNSKQAAMDSTVKQCPVCKMTLPDDSDFCQYCGTKIDFETRTENRTVLSAAKPVSFTENQEDDVSVKKDTNTIEIKTGDTIPPEIVDNQNKDDLEEQKRPNNLWTRIGLAVLILALVGLNIFQVFNMKNKTTQISALEQQVAAGKAENDTLNRSLITLESDKKSLENRLSELESSTTSKEIESLIKEKDTLYSQIKTKESKITSLNTQISSLKKEKADLQTKINNLTTSNAKATAAYDAMMRFSYGAHNSDYFSDAEVLVVKVGQAKTTYITSKLYNSNIQFQGDNNNASANWGNSWSNDRVSFTVTGKREGTTIYTFTNDANRTEFRILVIVLPK